MCVCVYISISCINLVYRTMESKLSFVHVMYCKTYPVYACKLL